LGRRLLSGAQPALQKTLEAEQRQAAQEETVDDLSDHTVYQTVNAIVKQTALCGAFLFFVFSSVPLSAVPSYTIPSMSTVCLYCDSCCRDDCRWLFGRGQCTLRTDCFCFVGVCWTNFIIIGLFYRSRVGCYGVGGVSRFSFRGGRPFA